MNKNITVGDKRIPILGGSFCPSGALFRAAPHPLPEVRHGRRLPPWSAGPASCSPWPVPTGRDGSRTAMSWPPATECWRRDPTRRKPDPGCFAPGVTACRCCTPAGRSPPSDPIPMQDMVLLPGLVKAHGHDHEQPLIGLARDEALTDWLDHAVNPFTGFMNARRAELSDLLGCTPQLAVYRMARVCDIHYGITASMVHHCNWNKHHLKEIAEANEAAGTTHDRGRGQPGPPLRRRAPGPARRGPGSPGPRPGDPGRVRPDPLCPRPGPVLLQQPGLAHPPEGLGSPPRHPPAHPQRRGAPDHPLVYAGSRAGPHAGGVFPRDRNPG